MTSAGCRRISLADLADYASGDVAAVDAAALEDHVFACVECAARAAELDALARGVGAAARSGEIGGFISDAVLNRLSRDGVRVRTFTLTPGAVVPCAVWAGDELMALRLRGDFDRATEVTVTQHAGGREVGRATGAVAGAHDELIFATPASEVRQLPDVELELVLTARVDGEERAVGRYTLVHGGSMSR